MRQCKVLKHVQTSALYSPEDYIYFHRLYSAVIGQDPNNNDRRALSLINYTGFSRRSAGIREGSQVKRN